MAYCRVKSTICVRYRMMFVDSVNNVMLTDKKKRRWKFYNNNNKRKTNYFSIPVFYYKHFSCTVIK